jgi:hypothetical protein
MLGALEELAMAGGTGHYYPATSPDELAAALSAITGSVATCAFTLGTSPPDANNVTVYLDQTLIARDGNNGWGFASDTRSIVLHGESCKVLKASNAATLTVHFNCAGTPSP